MEGEGEGEERRQLLEKVERYRRRVSFEEFERGYEEISMFLGHDYTLQSIIGNEQLIKAMKACKDKNKN